ncbi:MAG: zeta toxin family protein [Bacteroidales bacterium]|nr:zeta toxin family protein [Bacteroidales bacterium]
MPNLFIISGCNGAGKTTASMTVLPETLQCHEFVNCDEMAKGLNPLNPDSAKVAAARLMLPRIRRLIAHDADFAIETTLATKSYHALVKNAQEKGYDVKLLYFWLQSPELALQRVAERVKNGGHNVEEHIVRRRYASGIRNLFKLYLPVVDYFILIDNSVMPREVIAEGNIHDTVKVYNEEKFKKLRQYDNSKSECEEK